VHWLVSSDEGGVRSAVAEVSVEQAEGSYGLEDYRLGKKHARQYKLSKRVREISGLASSPDGRLFGHDDERAVIYEIDVQRGDLVKAFALGDPVERGDFEGLAVGDGRFHLVDSRGIVLVGKEGENGERVAFERIDTGVGKKCDVEGLAFRKEDRSLVLACKEPLGKGRDQRVRIHHHSLQRESTQAGSIIAIQLSDLSRGIKGKEFHPSGIEVHPVTGHYFLVASRELAMAEVTRDGEVVAVRALSEHRHRQVEGIAFSPDLSIILADEGGGGRARLTLYAP